MPAELRTTSERKSEAPARAPLIRRLFGYLLISAGSLCSIYMALILFAFWALGGAEGVGYALSVWSIFAVTALGPGLLAVGVALVGEHARLSGALRSAPGIVGLSLLALVGATWLIPRLQSEPPYPFTDARKGSLIAYTAPDGIRLARAEGGGSWRVPGTGSMDSPHWAPDGERFAAVDLGSSGQAYSFARDGSDRDRLPAAGIETTPAWSPDGRRIAVVGGDVRIRLRPLVPGLRETVLPLDGNEPDWSPDGTRLAFQSNAEQQPAPDLRRASRRLRATAAHHTQGGSLRGSLGPRRAEHRLHERPGRRRGHLCRPGRRQRAPEDHAQHGRRHGPDVVAGRSPPRLRPEHVGLDEERDRRRRARDRRGDRDRARPRRIRVRARLAAEAGALGSLSPAGCATATRAGQAARPGRSRCRRGDCGGRCGRSRRADHPRSASTRSTRACRPAFTV